MATETPDGWTKAPLAAFVTRITYGFTNPMPTTTDGPFMVTARDIHDGRIDYTTARRTSPDAYDTDLTDKSRPQVGDVLLTKDGSIGRVAVCDRPGICVNQSVAVIRPTPQILPRYLRFLLESPGYQRTMEADSDGTTIKHIYITRVDKMPILVPPIIQQQAILQLLGALDDKIELNRQMNETLEAVARALFKSWFVDFDPIRDKSEGRDTGLPAEVEDLFPDSLVYSGLGDMPRGWHEGALGEVADHPRRSVQPDQIHSSTPYIALEHMPKNSIMLPAWGVAGGLESNKFEFKRGEILFGKLRPYFHKVGVAPVDGICSTDIVVVRPVDTAWFGFVLGHFSSNAFVDYANAGSIGTKMPRTSWPEWRATRLPFLRRLSLRHSHD